MERIKITWEKLSGAERLLLGIVVGVVFATCILAAVALVKRPDDISNPDVTFEEASKPQPQPESKPADKRGVDWPRYGYDTDRTKFLNAQKVRPPFRKVWKYDQDQLIEFAPIVVGVRMYLIDNDGVFIALNNDTGKVIWKKRHGKLNASSPAFWKGMLLAVNLEPGQALGIRARDGKVMWSKDLPGRAESSPIVAGGTMYFGTEPGDFFALDARTGKTKWSTKLDGAVKAAPAFTDGSLYVGDYAGQFYSLRADDGAIRWKTSDLGAGLGRSGRFYSTAAVAFGRVYVGNVDGRVYSFDRQTGEIAWTFSAGDFVYSGVAAADAPKTKPSVYFGSHDKQVYSLDAESGKVNWAAEPGGQVSGPATVIGDVVYVSTFSGNATVGFDLTTGRRVFKFDEGEYGPVVSDGKRLFLVGGSEVVAFRPIKIYDYKAKKGTKGIVPPAERRRARSKGAEKQGSGGEGKKGSPGKKKG
ncbi:MAG TPA: PQQ-binding-like beta-propeller repeat protein [Solirubrobacterales bacterium]|nr:PQQ-binding-like beta-propeller repeat protein [Solirubrobacterales bacterium]